jgi:predicted RNase H-like HicB family nuclease
MKLKDKLTLYQIVVEPCEEGGYFASCPLLQGCHAEGKTFGEAIDNLKDVIKAHLEIRQAKGEIIPFVEMKSSEKINFQIPVPVCA